MFLPPADELHHLPDANPCCSPLDCRLAIGLCCGTLLRPSIPCWNCHHLLWPVPFPPGSPLVHLDCTEVRIVLQDTRVSYLTQGAFPIPCMLSELRNERGLTRHLTQYPCSDSAGGNPKGRFAFPTPRPCSGPLCYEGRLHLALSPRCPQCKGT